MFGRFVLEWVTNLAAANIVPVFYIFYSRSQCWPCSPTSTKTSDEKCEITVKVLIVRALAQLAGIVCLTDHEAASSCEIPAPVGVSHS